MVCRDKTGVSYVSGYAVNGDARAPTSVPVWSVLILARLPAPEGQQDPAGQTGR
jgi:hypothetical protein